MQELPISKFFWIRKKRSLKPNEAVHAIMIRFKLNCGLVNKLSERKNYL